MTILRIQDAHGRGPWKPGFSACWVESRADHRNLLPWMLEFDKLPKRKPNEAIACGCMTVEQLRRWFTPSEYQTLKKHGYQAVRIAADRILAESGIQCVFARTVPLPLGAEPFELY